MRIAHLISHPGLNGVATSLKALVDAQLAAGHRILIVHPRHSWIAQQQFAGPVELLESSFKTKPQPLRDAGYPIWHFGRTLVHAHGSGANKYAMVYRMVDGVPVVMTAHSRHFQIPWMFAHAVIGLSRQTIDYYTSRLLVARRRIFDVPNMFDVSSVQPVAPADRAAARRMLGLAPEALVVGTVGTVGRRKQQAALVRAVSLLRAQGVPAEAVLIGDLPAEGEARAELDAALALPGIRPHVHMPGHREDAVALTAAFDLYVCASAVEEAPIAPVEAMARCLPVVSTRVGNMPDLLPADCLVTVGDVAALAGAIGRQLADADRRARDGAAGRGIIAERLSPGVVLPKIEHVYDFAIRSARDRGGARFTELHGAPGG
jgi:glycosyltransferase involved in cell wall biosynthesis